MPDTLTAFDKVEDALAAVLEANNGTGQSLDGYTILTDHPADEAIEAQKSIVIATAAATPEQANEQNQTIWAQMLDIAVFDGPQAPGMISRRVKITIGKIHALLAADRSLGGRLQDLQEIDIAGTQAEGKDAHGASVQYRAEFYTPRGDWFTILGAGAQF